MLKKNLELSSKAENQEETLITITNKNKSFEAEQSKIEKKYQDLEKTYKKTNFDQKSTYDLIIKIFKSKVNSLKKEISHLKNFTANEINQIKKESEIIVESLFNKLKQFNLNNEKDLDYSIKYHKENLETEFIKRLEQKDQDSKEEFLKVNKKWEKHLMEEYRRSEKLEKEKEKNVIYFFNSLD